MANIYRYLQIALRLLAVLLLSAINAMAMPLAPYAPGHVEFFPHQRVFVAEHINVHFAARAPPLAVANVVFAGAAVAEHGNGVTMHGHGTHVASLGFGVGIATNRTQLIDDLVAGGTRITPENVVDIRSINGRTVWLETGNSRAGLQHIVGAHGPEFAQRGITEAQIPDVVFTALQRNNVVGYQGRGTGRPIYEFDYGGQTHQLAITVGDNGFIVGANFR